MQTADQILIYMILASGSSQILYAPLCEKDHTRHIEAAIEVITQITKCQFTVEINLETNCRLIQCDGI